MTTIDDARRITRIHVWLWDRSTAMTDRRCGRNRQRLGSAESSKTIRRNLLADRFGGDAKDWSVSWDRAGRPCVVRSPHRGPVFLSAARSGTVEAFAASAGGELGVDVETLTHDDDRLAYVARSFSPDEQQGLAQRSDRGQEIIELWTRNEAIGKALGVGLDLPAGQQQWDMTSWHIGVCSPRADLCLATATRSLGAQVMVETKWIENGGCLDG